VAPVIAGFWERAEFPSALLPKLGALGIGGGALSGHGCPGLSVTSCAMACVELARVDGSMSTFFLVHSFLAALTGAHACSRLWGGRSRGVAACTSGASRGHRWPCAQMAAHLGSCADFQPRRASQVGSRTPRPWALAAAAASLSLRAPADPRSPHSPCRSPAHRSGPAGQRGAEAGAAPQHGHLCQGRLLGADRARPRQRRELPFHDRSPRRRRLGAQRPQALDRQRCADRVLGFRVGSGSGSSSTGGPSQEQGRPCLAWGRSRASSPASQQTRPAERATSRQALA
jgi:hypothetical protein